VIERVAELEKVDAGDLYYDEGVIRSRTKAHPRYTLAQVALAGIRKLQRDTFVKHESINDTNPSATGAHFAHVEVDTQTGMVKLLDYLAVHDIGKVINREICVAQVQGAVMMGAGAALLEHSDVKPNGTPTSSLRNYHVLNVFDAPAVRVEFIEDGQTGGPFGAKAIGEISHVPVAPAVVGAVNDALGSDLCDLPLNPDRIVALMQQRAAS
jgi:CO/xanthine dehydrogenase Mo-binding subunit